MYRVKNWQEHFENHESRKVKRVSWVAVPNKHDGKGYRRVAASPDGVPVLAAWTLILQVASKMPVRGVLADEDGPLDSTDLAAMTGFPAEIFEKAFKLLIEPKIGWLERVDEQAEIPTLPDNLPQSPGVAGKSALEQNRTEQNGTEGKGIGSRTKRAQPTPPPEDFRWVEPIPDFVKQNFTRPQVEEETQRFLDHHRAKGSLFKDWQAAWRTWMRNSIKFRNKDSPPGEDHGWRPAPLTPELVAEMEGCSLEEAKRILSTEARTDDTIH